jgi:hypothetical protein
MSWEEKEVIMLMKIYMPILLTKMFPAETATPP